MSKIVPSLNLNRTPQLADNYGMVCAKNVRVLKDGTLAPDTGITSMSLGVKIGSCARQLLADCKKLNDIIQDIEGQIGHIDEQIGSTFLLNKYEVWLANKTYNYFEQGTDGVTLDKMNDPTSQWYFNILTSDGAGSNVNNPKIINSYSNERDFLAALNAHDGGTDALLLFPVTSNLQEHSGTALHPYLLRNRLDQSDPKVADLINIMNNFDADRAQKYLELASASYNNAQYRHNFGVYKDANDEWVIERFAILYAITFYIFWAQDFADFLDAAEEELNREYYDLLQEKNILERQLASYTEQYNEKNTLYHRVNNFNVTDNKFEILGVIPYNTEYYVFVFGKDISDNNNNISLILNINTEGNTKVCNCNWNWSEGTIDGAITLNLRGEKMLCIAEHLLSSSSTNLIPIKTINLAKSSVLDEESIYTQTPEIPILQLRFGGYFPAKVSPGVYQFFIRYEISDDTYTNWFPVSRPLYTAKKERLITNQGSLTYADLEVDSDKGFILDIDWVYYKTLALRNSYKRFQLGFIHSSKDGSVARSWKHFDIDTEIIYFDRAPEYIEEIDITDLTESIYGLYNVQNITHFKNKIYISNYKETNFNPDTLEFYANSIKIELTTTELESISSNSIRTNSTLIPFQTYAFYIHFVKSTGEFTNGYKIGNNIKVTDDVVKVVGSTESHDYIYNACDGWSEDNPYLKATCNALIYPIFTFTKSLPDGYIACFISMKRVKGTTMQLFNTYTPFDSEDWRRSDYIAYADCLELDTLLEGVLHNIPISGRVGATDPSLVETEGDYHPSYDASNLFLFGAAGKVAFKYINSGHEGSYNTFITLAYEANEKNSKLERCTPIMCPSISQDRDWVYNDVNELNLQGFLCSVEKPNISEYDKYIAGNDWYTKNASGGSLELARISNTTDYDNMQHSDINNIYSNYNLDYMSITQTLTPKIARISSSGSVTDSNILVLTIDSMTLSSIYELKSMFYDYTKKLYATYDKTNNIVVFDNTIRSSTLIGDEDSANIYKFNAVDYYNVPADKGKIVNLKSIGNAILVHTQDSLYKFSGNNSLSAAGGEQIQLSESEVFDTGVVEMFGSEFGFAGLKSKNHCIASENGYTFYDADSNNFYSIQGQGELKVISDPIRKLLDCDVIQDVHFASDYYNDRIFICIEFRTSRRFITLSYNFRYNAFISLHDFKFDKSFNTKTYCYFVKNTTIYKKQLVFSSAHKNTDLVEISNFYPTFYKHISETINGITVEKDISRPYIDIIINENYEASKTANYINWICNLINKFSTDAKPVQDNTETVMALNALNTAQETLEKYMVYGIQIYSNICATKILLVSYDDDISLIPVTQRYLYSNVFRKDKPYFERGRWNFNYFRNSLNIDNQNNSDNMSLIYGNYFVVRVIFDPYVNFKFENINLNYSKDNETVFS